MVEVSSTNLLSQVKENGWQSQQAAYAIDVVPSKTESVGAINKSDLPSDTVNFSNKKVTKTKRNLLIGAGSLVAIGLGIFAGVKMYQKHFISVAQKTFKSIYMREDITKEETKQILKRFKEIEKIEDKEEYIKALFNEIKKNFGLGGTNIKLTIEEGNLKGMSVPVCNTANGFINMPLSYPRKSMMTLFHHEFRHAKQHDITYNYSPLEFLKNFKYITPKKMAIVQSKAESAVASGEFKTVNEFLDGKTVEEYLVDYWQKEFKGNFTNSVLTEKEKNFAKKMLNSSHNPIKEGYNEGDGFKKYMKFLYLALKNISTAIERDAYWAEIKTGFLFKTMPKKAIEI